MNKVSNELQHQRNFYTKRPGKSKRTSSKLAEFKLEISQMRAQKTVKPELQTRQIIHINATLPTLSGQSGINTRSLGGRQIKELQFTEYKLLTSEEPLAR